MKRVICSNAISLTVQQLLSIAKKQGANIRFNNRGAVYTSFEDDYTSGASIEYLQNAINKYSDEDLSADPTLIVDEIDELETFCTTYDQVQSYKEDKKNILNEFGLLKPGKSDEFYSNNMDVLRHVFEIASSPSSIETTLMNWANSGNSVESSITRMVDVTDSQVIFKGGPYGLGLPAIILEGNGMDTDFSKKYRTPEQEDVVFSRIEEIQEYLESQGISSEYVDTRKCLVCDKTAFN